MKERVKDKRLSAEDDETDHNDDSENLPGKGAANGDGMLERNYVSGELVHRV